LLLFEPGEWKLELETGNWKLELEIIVVRGKLKKSNDFKTLRANDKQISNAVRNDNAGWIRCGTLSFRTQ
jgi:hypothetical protein